MVKVTIALLCKNREQQFELTVSSSHQTFQEAYQKAKRLADDVVEKSGELVLSMYTKSVEDLGG
jgi:hypothetical protein